MYILLAYIKGIQKFMMIGLPFKKFTYSAITVALVAPHGEPVAVPL